MRGVCREFADLDGRKTLVFVSRGFERTPGQNFLARVDVAVKAAGVTRASGGIPPAFVDAKPNLPGASMASGGGVTATRLSQVEDFERWIAASGITLHFLDPYFGSDAPTAETSTGDKFRDIPAERLNLQDSPRQVRGRHGRPRPAGRGRLSRRGLHVPLGLVRRLSPRRPDDRRRPAEVVQGRREREEERAQGLLSVGVPAESCRGRSSRRRPLAPRGRPTAGSSVRRRTTAAPAPGVRS